MKSNCLHNALRYRLKGCPVYRVYPLDSDWNNHHVWWDCELGCYRHFTWAQENQRSLPRFFWRFTRFEGTIENYPYDKEKVKLKLVF